MSDPLFHRVHYSIDDRSFGYVAEGFLAEAENRCLLAGDDDLIRNMAWHKDGYQALRAWDEETSRVLEASVTQVISDAIAAVCHRRPSFALDQYHTVVNDEEHLAIIDHLRILPFNAPDLMPIPALDAAISRVLEADVSCFNPQLKPPLAPYSCSLRIIRPRSHDNNPLHKDVWLDWLRHAVNLYIPVAGSNALSSLSLIPGSHLWKESEIKRTRRGSKVDGIAYNVPSVVASDHGLAMIRPPLKDNEIMVFSPYMIHGGACNLNPDTTRISLEMRFWRKV